MKRRHHSSSCSSSSSSSCIESPITANIEPLKKPKPKRVRAKKIPTTTTTAAAAAAADNSAATSAKSRSSIYRGVTRHRWTGRFEAHLWDKTTWNSIQNKKGRQIYLGAYDNEEDAARTYDLAALKYWGPASILNFPVEGYTGEIEEMQKLTKEEYLASLRRRSSGFSRGVSKYRGVARHHHNGRWEARIGRVCGNKYLYLGTYSTQEEAAAAYDMAAIEFRGSNAVTNFDISNYANKLTKVQPEVQLIRQEEQLQVKKETNPITPLENNNNNVQPDEAREYQEEYGNQVALDDEHQQSIPKLESMMDSIVMDPTEEHEHPWDLCLDIGYNILPILDMPMEKASEVLDYKDFEDNIECIFDDNLFLDDVIKIDGSDGLVDGDLNGQDALTSPSSSELSNTTASSSVCSDVVI
ncbi:hypothetical protein ABFS83_02G106700 [Erythranthe nasuta]